MDFKKKVAKEVSTEAPKVFDKCVKAIFDDDIEDIGSYIKEEVLKPQANKFVFDCIQGATGGIKNAVSGILGFLGGKILDATEMKLYGEVSPNRRKSNTTVGDRTSYSSCYKTSSTTSKPAQVRSSRNPEVMYFSTASEAEDVLFAMKDYISQYGAASVADYYEFSNKPSLILTTDNGYGWTTLDGASVRRSTDLRYYLALPRPCPIQD